MQIGTTFRALEFHGSGRLSISSGLDVEGPLNFKGELTRDGVTWKPTQWTSLSYNRLAFDIGDVNIGQSLTVHSNLDLIGPLITHTYPLGLPIQDPDLHSGYGS